MAFVTVGNRLSNSLSIGLTLETASVMTFVMASVMAFVMASLMTFVMAS